MTTATFDRQDGSYEISIVGHAGYNWQDPTRPDVVCAACSILSYLLDYYLMQEKHSNRIHDYCFKDSEAGTHITFWTSKENSKRVNLIIDVIYTGFEILSRNYPKNVEIKGKWG